MKASASILVTAAALVTLIVGGIISAFSWQAGLAIMLASVGVACVSRYRTVSSGFAGSLAMLPAFLIFLYIYGSVDRTAPVYYTNVSDTVWLVIAAGSLSLVGGLWIGGGSRQTVDKLQLSGIDFATNRLFFGAGIIAILVSVVNYATGDIALLSSDINGARFGGNYGRLGQLWVFVHPITQVSVIISLLMFKQRHLSMRWALLGLCSATSLVLAGGRSLLAIALIAFGILVLELRRPKVLAVLLALFLGIAIFGFVGQVRALSSSGASDAQSFMSKRGLDGWFGSAELSLQTGPRVMTLAVDSLQGSVLGGRFLVGDMPLLRDESVMGSDRLITETIGRDPSIVGGSPPTLFGGLFLDFGWLGVILGAVMIGVVLAFSRRLMYRSATLPTAIWFSYLAAYILISGYSYFSVRPSWIVVLLLCAAAANSHRVSSAARSRHIRVGDSPYGRRTLPI